MNVQIFKKIGSHKASGAVLVLGSKKTHKVEDGEMHQTGSNGKRVKGIRAGFTLVELLVVVAIIGLLVGLTIPAVFAALGVFNRAACKFEVNALSDAVEKYRSKYGDYPPDGSSWPVMEAHLRKAFPNILVSELNLLNPANSATYAYIHNDYAGAGRVMDPAEALVFFLGGFSSDAQRPFTGPGGPFVLNGSAYQYNGSRQNSFYDFPAARLTMSASLVSTDETVYDSPITPDLMPVFLSYKNKLEFGNPYVYFDSRTYQSKANPPSCNYHLTRASAGAARPYLSEQVNTLSTATNKPKLYENKQTFQILSPGLDGQYAGMVGSSGVVLFTSKGVLCSYDSTSLGFVPLTSNLLPAFVLDNSQMRLRPMTDNVGNFTESNILGENK